jgi:hypothetical protein
VNSTEVVVMAGIWWQAALAALVTTTACGGTASTTDQPEPVSGAPESGAAETAAPAAATLTVENLGFADVTVYAVSATGNRIRLGQVNGNSTQKLALPDFLVRGGESLRFFADPIGGAQGPVSEELFVAPGESVTMTIPPR